jgi:hypothetical protein
MVATFLGDGLQDRNWQLGAPRNVRSGSTLHIELTERNTSPIDHQAAGFLALDDDVQEKISRVLVFLTDIS